MESRSRMVAMPWTRAGGRLLCGLFLCWSWAALGANLQFDVFPGFDQYAREGCWFPIVFEIQNDGPTFTGIIEVRPAALGGDQVWRTRLELPTHTRKRVFGLLFGANRNEQWDAALEDERGKILSKQAGVGPQFVAWEGTLVAALPRTYAGGPVFPTVFGGREVSPASRTVLAEQMPDNPMALEGLNAVYLNSEKALDLKANQARALLDWVREGGRLIFVPEQAADLNGLPWLRAIFPCELQDLKEAPQAGQTLEDWTSAYQLPSSLPPPYRRGPAMRDENARSRKADAEFAHAALTVFSGRIDAGRAVLESSGQPLAVERSVGRGRLTVLLFNPEREPFRSWSNRGWFWTKLLDVPPNFTANYYRQSLDSLFGALLDTTQVQKLPVEWLLLLLVGYLLVIGPGDYFWLKKINRQMLTWLTFPAYVAGFSVLIYFIGYKLRAGVNEWNEMNVVDVLPRGSQADLRGFTFVSIYSSANNSFPMARAQAFSAVRGEFFSYGFNVNARGIGGQLQVNQRDAGFDAAVQVPVWTSAMVVNDWYQPSQPIPIQCAIRKKIGGWTAAIKNNTATPMPKARIILDGAIWDLGPLPAHAAKEFALMRGEGQLLARFVQQHSSEITYAIQQRRFLLGRQQNARLTDPMEAGICASFCSQLSGAPGGPPFIFPRGFDLSPDLRARAAILLALAPAPAPISALPQFTPPRRHEQTLYRLVMPMDAADLD